MQTKTFETPALYGDHHVSEVRQILMGIPGVEDVYASSSFQVVQVTFDPEKVNESELEKALDGAGYLGEISFPVETGASPYDGGGGDTYFRHTTAYTQTRLTVNFAQNVSYLGRPLWPCPGMGIITIKEMEEK
jgi:copper chaperone CopZ